MSLRGEPGAPPPKLKGGAVPQDEVRGDVGGSEVEGARKVSAGMRDSRLGSGRERQDSAGTRRSGQSGGDRSDHQPGGGDARPDGAWFDAAAERAPSSAASFADCENYYTAADADRQLHMLGERVSDEARRQAAKEAYVALNSWIPGTEAPGAFGAAGRAGGAGGEDAKAAWKSRMAYAEAERRAAAADAAEFYEEMDRMREEERTHGGLALSQAVRDARMLPWTDAVARSLAGEGSGGLAEAAVRRYEPPCLSSDPNKRRQIEESWENTTKERLVRERGLVKEGWLWKVSLTGLDAADASVVAATGGQPFWCSLVEHSGLSWSTEKRSPLCGLMNWEAVSKVEMAKFLPGTFIIEGGEQRHPPQGDIRTGKLRPTARRLLFRSDDAEELRMWFAAVSLGFETYKVHRGGDVLRIVGEDWCEPGSTATFKVPQIDVKYEDANSKDRISRNVVWFVKEGDKVTAGDVICTIERMHNQQPAEVSAPRSGVVLELFQQRTDPRSGDKYTRIGDNMIKIKMDAEWKTRYKFVKLEEHHNHRPDAASSATDSVVAHTPGTVLQQATHGRPNAWSSRTEAPETGARIGRGGAAAVSSLWPTPAGSGVLTRAGTSILEGGAENSRHRMTGSVEAMRATSLTPALYQQLVHQSAKQDADGFWQTAKLYSQPKQSGAYASMPSPSERHNHTVQTIRSRYSDKALAAAATILNSSM